MFSTSVLESPLFSYDVTVSAVGPALSPDVAPPLLYTHASFLTSPTTNWTGDEARSRESLKGQSKEQKETHPNAEHSRPERCNTS